MDVQVSREDVLGSVTLHATWIRVRPDVATVALETKPQAGGSYKKSRALKKFRQAAQLTPTNLI